MPANDRRAWLSTYHTHHCPTSACVQALLSSLLMVSIFVSPARSTGYVTAHHSKCIILVSQSFVSTTYYILLLQLTNIGHHYHLILAVILILKRTTFLCRLLDMSPERALTHAELDYRDANIDLNIQQYLASSQYHSIELFATFIMATDDIGSLILPSVCIIPHSTFSSI
ncbi:hypothetical protein EDB84DRAFT_1472533 [Lactarius hengduanensis]|nr:hypothetical protein EDB84DRAFT_1472533 [Lactarius hengduanensis]